MNPLTRSILATSITLFSVVSISQAADPKPIRALLITGGCCHDYAAQKEILKKGLEQRLNITVELMHSEDKNTKPSLDCHNNPDYAKGFDIVIHDECAADISNPENIEKVLAPHRSGVPALVLHCAMHSYRNGTQKKPAEEGTPDAIWFEFTGMQSSGHGAQEPITIQFEESPSPILKGLSGWTTGKEELYNTIKVFKTATVLAKGTQSFKVKNAKEGEPAEKLVDGVIIWTNIYKEKTRVFGTTLAHNNSTVEDPRYLELVSRGVLWATKNMADDGTPKEGYVKPTIRDPRTPVPE